MIPGKTPCLRCAQLSEREQSGVTSQRTLCEESSVEYPQIAAHAIAAMAASQIVALCDERTVKGSESANFSQLSPEHFGKITVVDYQALAEPQVVAITRHPLCGCAF